MSSPSSKPTSQQAALSHRLADPICNSAPIERFSNLLAAGESRPRVYSISEDRHTQQAYSVLKPPQELVLPRILAFHTPYGLAAGMCKLGHVWHRTLQSLKRHKYAI